MNSWVQIIHILTPASGIYQVGQWVPGEWEWGHYADEHERRHQDRGTIIELRGQLICPYQCFQTTPCLNDTYPKRGDLCEFSRVCGCLHGLQLSVFPDKLAMRRHHRLRNEHTPCHISRMEWRLTQSSRHRHKHRSNINRKL